MQIVLVVVAAFAMNASEPNPPPWPETVHVLYPGSADLNETIQSLYRSTRSDLYISQRAAVLFQPGEYSVDLPVGYYTTVHGLGVKPEDVRFTGPNGVHQAESGGNFIQFWRSAENLANRPSSGKMVWSVSQASVLRRMQVEGDLVFGSTADTLGSGGYVSNLKISGGMNFTKQQQWIARNCEIGGKGTSYFKSPPRSVNFVFVGTTGSPEPSAPGQCTDSATNPVAPVPQKLVVDESPVSIEKPYIRIEPASRKHTKTSSSAAAGSPRYQLVTPMPQFGTAGAQWGPAYEHVDGFERVFVATNATAAHVINAKLAAGLHVVLTPGVYALDEPIRIGRTASPYQVLLGLGLATLVPMRGDAAIVVADVPGVRVAGLLLQAGPVNSKALIAVGSKVSDRHHQPGSCNNGVCNGSSAANPVLLADVFGRVGGPDVDPATGLGPAVSATVMMELNASNVVLDNVWLWRADVDNGKRTRDVNHSLVVNGHNVTVYGLAAEHTQSDNVVWNGEGGRVYFYQAELDGLAHTPGDKTPDFGPNGVSGYRVNARDHHAIGVGVYCWFSSPGVFVQAGVKVLHKETEAGIVCPFQWVWENTNTPPKGNSTIEHAILVVNR